MDGVAVLHPQAGIVGQRIGDHFPVSAVMVTLTHTAPLASSMVTLPLISASWAIFLGLRPLEELLDTGKTLG